MSTLCPDVVIISTADFRMQIEGKLEWTTCESGIDTIYLLQYMIISSSLGERVVLSMHPV